MYETIWIIDDDNSIRWVLEKALQDEDLKPVCFESGNDALAQLNGNLPELIITDVRMPGIDGIELLNRIHEQHPQLPIIVMTAHSDLDSAVAAFQGGAFEYLPKPFDIDDAIALVKRALAFAQEQNSTAPEPNAQAEMEIIGEAPSMQEVFRAIGRLSQTDITVLINGESGTGKELVAHALHKHGNRAAHPFIALNMAAIPQDLIESELFGHEKGAFTGAGSQRRGRFEQADGGTLFLDEIGDMPLDTQTRLLRVLADGEFYRVGGHTPVKVNVRIIAATHQNLENLVQQGTFREDLFHRLNVIRIMLPKLADRKEDIPMLANHFLAKAAEEMNMEAKILPPETAEYLTRLTWPGNVRQLENTCRWLTVMASGREILIEDLPQDLKETTEETSATGSSWESCLNFWAENEFAHNKTGVLNEALPAFEQIMIKAALKHTRGRKRDASILLGWGRNTLTRKLKEYDFPDSKSSTE